MNTETTPAATPPKAGVKTTEFWLVVGFTLLAQIGPLVSSLPEQYAAWALPANAIVIAIYALARGKAKSVGVVIPLLLVSLIMASLTSCAVVQSRMTGQDIVPEAVVPVDRPDSPPVNVAQSDIARAQLGDPAKIYGLYDVGRAESAINKVTGAGK